MAYTGFQIPDLVDASFSTQAKVASEDWQIVADGLRGNGVQSGCVVAQRAAGANMSVDVSAGTINREGTAIAVAGGNLVIAAADGTNPRIDIVHVNNAGTKAVTTGTPSAAPAPPAIPQVAAINNIVLAFVYVPAGDTTINTNQIVDKRALVAAPSGGAGTGTVTTSGTPATGNLTQFSGSTVITNGNLSGDVTTAGTLAATIAANAVSYAKIQDVSVASRLLGRGSSGAGDPQEITLGTNLSMSGTTLNATGGGGSTPTGTGFPHITGGTQDAAAKLVDTADINNAQVTYAKVQNVAAASRLLGRGSAGGAGSPEEIILGANLTMTGTTLAASAGTGGDFSSNTATSVDSEVVLFSGTAGKTGKRATGTGVARLAAGVQSAAELSGDVTTSGSNATTIAAGAVTYAKMQDVAAASRLLGRGSAAGAGDPQEITLGTNLTMSGTTLNASGGGGSTPTGTGFTHITAGAEDAAAKLVDTADVNNAQITYGKIQNVSAASRLLGRGSAGGAGSAEELTLGTNLSMSGTTLNASGSGGSVTVRKNTGADVGTRPRLNLIEGSNVTLTVADDAGGNEVDITIAASGGGGSSDTVGVVTADVNHTTNSVTLENATGLVLTTTASATEYWRVELYLLMATNSIGASTSDYKFGWSVSGAQTGFWGGNIETGGNTGSVIVAPPLTATLAFGSVSVATGQMLIHLRAMIFSNNTAGTVQFMFAQNSTASGAIATVKAGSVLIARKTRS